MADEPRLSVESIAGQRPYQEDAVLARYLSDGRLLVAVADGMGGHAAGEVASALALETLVSALEDGQEIDSSFRMANARVFDMAQEPGKHGMGTTLVAALVDDGEYLVANIGDSRAYLVTVDGIRQISNDHSFVAEAVRRGQSLEEAMATPWRDALTRYVGTEGQAEVDVFGPFPVRDDSALILCSDGLYKTLSDEDLRRIFLQSSTLDGAARTLVSEAFDRGSDDNISVAIAEYGLLPRSAVQTTMPIDFTPPLEDDPGPATATFEMDGEPTTPSLAGDLAPDGSATAPTEDGVEAATPTSGLLRPVIVAAVLMVATLMAVLLTR